MKKQCARLCDPETGLVILPNLEVAATLWAQTIGLMGRKELATASGLLIPHCNAIHTAFVRFPIDVLFLDAQSMVLRLVPALAPWRIYGPVRGAKSVVELPAGTLRQKQIVIGQQFTVHRSEAGIPGDRT
jgi:uncharacterized membrane protein (UPF0127 family)